MRRVLLRATFPCAVHPVQNAPGDLPGGKQGDVITVEFTVSASLVSPVSMAARRSRTARLSFRSRRTIWRRMGGNYD